MLPSRLYSTRNFEKTRRVGQEKRKKKPPSPSRRRPVGRHVVRVVLAVGEAAGPVELALGRLLLAPRPAGYTGCVGHFCRSAAGCVSECVCTSAFDFS